MVFSTLAQGALVALLALPKALAMPPTCGFEGQSPCDGAILLSY